MAGYQRATSPIGGEMLTILIIVLIVIILVGGISFGLRGRRRR